MFSRQSSQTSFSSTASICRLLRKYAAIVCRNTGIIQDMAFGGEGGGDEADGTADGEGGVAAFLPWLLRMACIPETRARRESMTLYMNLGPAMVTAPDGGVWLSLLGGNGALVRICPRTMKRTLVKLPRPAWLHSMRFIHVRRTQTPG